jgi:hypothetical protein
LQTFDLGLGVKSLARFCYLQLTDMGGPVRQNRTEGSNPSCSAIQSEVQRIPLEFRWELQEIGAIPRISTQNRTRESALLNAAGALYRVFL